MRTATLMVRCRTVAIPRPGIPEVVLARASFRQILAEATERPQGRSTFRCGRGYVRRSVTGLVNAHMNCSGLSQWYGDLKIRRSSKCFGRRSRCEGWKPTAADSVGCVLFSSRTNLTGVTVRPDASCRWSGDLQVPGRGGEHDRIPATSG